MLSMGVGIKHAYSWAENPHYYNDKLFRGPLSWTGVSLTALWDYDEWDTRPTFECGVGVYLLNHSIPASTLAVANTPVEDILVVPGINELVGISTDISTGFGAHMGIGAARKLTKNIWLTGGIQGTMIRSEFTRTSTYSDIDAREAQHALIIFDIKALVGLRYEL
jgi:hypothetical protein